MRLSRERATVKGWYHQFTPQSALLTDAIVARFTAIMIECFNKIGFGKFDVDILHRLSVLAPEVIAGQVLRKLNLAWNRESETARLHDALGLFSISLYPLIINESTTSESFKPEVMPILTRLVQTLNSNDETLCYLQFLSLQSILVLNIPLDKICSNAANFANQFLDACFRVIESENEELFKRSEHDIDATFGELLYESFCCLLSNVPNQKVNQVIRSDILFY